MIDDPRFLTRMNIPRLYWGCTFDKVPGFCDYLELVQSYALKIDSHIAEGRGLLLHGPYSSGKSAMATLLLRSLPPGVWGLFVMAEKMAGYVINNERFSVEESFQERMRSVDLLVIDEVVLHDTDTYRDHVVEEFVRDRIRDKKATILTTNLAPSDFQSEYPALGEALIEAVVPVKIDGHNFRKDRANELLREVSPG